VGSLLSDKWDMDAARRFLGSANSVAGLAPEKLTTDGHPCYPQAIQDVFGTRTVHRNNWYLKRHIERNLREIKQRYYPMLGFSAFRSAQRFWRAFEEVKRYFRPRSKQNQFLSRVQKLEQMFQAA
jgi:putative transposase